MYSTEYQVNLFHFPVLFRFPVKYSIVGNKLGKGEGMALPDLYRPVWEPVGGLGGAILSFVLSLFLSFFSSLSLFLR